MSVRRSLRVPLCAIAAQLASGCTFTHRCPVPDPVVEAAPGQRLPLAVEVRHVPGVKAEVGRRNSPFHLWVVDAAPPTRALFHRLVASMFDPVVAGTAAGEAASRAAAALEVRLDAADFRFVDAISGPYQASVAYRATLRAQDGTEIASFDVAGAAERPLQWELPSHCPGIGGAAAMAMQEAGAAFVRELAADPAVAAWLAGQAMPVPRFTVRPVESYALAAPAAVGPGVAMPPRTFQLRVGVGAFTGDVTGGRLEGARRGVSFTAGAEYRPARALGVAMEGGAIHRGYSPRTLPPGGALAVPRGVYLDTRTLGIGVRAFLPGRALEPWVGAMGHVMRTEVCAEYALLGIGGCGGAGVDWSAGFDVGAGLAVYPRRWALGVEVRRLFARANLDPLPGAASVGGVGVSLTLGRTLP
jgi:hypothetical protein